MCRLFGQISRGKSDARWGLLDARYSLLRQSRCRPKALQKDGWGLARWDESGRWDIVKSKGAVFKEAGRFRRLAKGIRSTLHLAHIRHASNPRKLPRNKIIGLDNSQPFAFENLAFAHNGTLNIPSAVADRALGRFAQNIRGNNDSEVLFWLFVKTWKESGRGDWGKVFSSMVRSIDRVWAKIPKRERKHPRPHHGLNFLASDGKSLAAHCLYDKADGKSLCGQNRPYFEMCYNIADGKIRVASEPLSDGPSWRPITRKHVWVAKAGGPVSTRKL